MFYEQSCLSVTLDLEQRCDNNNVIDKHGAQLFGKSYTFVWGHGEITGLEAKQELAFELY